MKPLVIFAAFALLTAPTLAQTLPDPHTPPSGKFNTTNYPNDRKAITAMRLIDGLGKHCSDDYVTVNPDGKIDYGFDEWKQEFTNAGSSFMSVTPVPGMEILRIYDGKTAILNNLLDVVLDTPKGDLKIRVQRMEVFMKRNGGWCFVAGQGTRVLFKEELGAMQAPSPKK
ncbi:nuclear transport factor 2 family protein [Spirosoma flavum]|uniref:Nuclear transport factor 2 family protein n=1 Tax=Spirosoma flavum TaxID=2048557 RepID=A0ABW6APW5_9BACT